MNKNQKNFYKVYSENLNNFNVFRKLNNTDYYLLYNVFLPACEYANSDKAFGGQTISITAVDKKTICSELEISDATFERTIKKLVDSNIFRRCTDADGKMMRGLYQVNPYVFGIGKDEDVFKLRSSAEKAGWFTDGAAKTKLVKSVSDNIVQIKEKKIKRVADKVSSIDAMFN